MDDQGERRAARAGEHEDWWSQLYSADASDTGRSGAGDSVDDRFDSVARTVGVEPSEPAAAPDARPESARPESGGDASAPGEAANAAADTATGPAGAAGEADAGEPAAAGGLGGQEPSGPADPAPGRTGAAEDPRLDRLTTALTVPESVRLPRQPGGERRGNENGELEEPQEPDRPSPVALPTADPDALGELVPDTVLDGGDYGSLTVRSVSLRGEAARAAGEPRRDALLTARFGSGEKALLLVAVAAGADGGSSGHRAARDICHSLGEAVGRSHARLAEDIMAGRRGALKSGLNRLTDRGYGKLRSQAAALGLAPEDYTAHLRCLLLPADPRCQTRVFFGVGEGGLFRLRGGEWQDIEPAVPSAAPARDAAPSGGAEPSVPASDPRPTMALGITVRADQPAAAEGPNAAPSGAGDGTDPAPAPASEPSAGPGPAGIPPSPTSGQPSAVDPADARTAAEGTLGETDPRQGDGAVDAHRGESGGTLPDMGAEERRATADAEPEPEPFRFRASMAQPGDTLLMCSPGLAEPLREEREFADELAGRWADGTAVPEFPDVLADLRRSVPGHSGDRTAVAVWEG